METPRNSDNYDISIHALHEESDRSHRFPPFARLFQSTLSMRRATRHFTVHSGSVEISIHALHEESDYPIYDETHRTELFQSTLSMRRATKSTGRRLSTWI